MKSLYRKWFLLLLLVSVLTGCEKNITPEEAEQPQETETASLITDEMKRNALTVEEAQQAEAGEDICVKGYLVAAGQSSLGNSDFRAPFDGSTALIMADRPSDASDDQFFKDELFPVSLSDAEKGIRNSYNLEDNPQYWNNYVYILGKRTKYMSVAGLKKIQAIAIESSHTPAAGDGSGDGGSSGGGDGGSGGGSGGGDGGGGNGGETYCGLPVQSIAQVIAAFSQQQYLSVSVKAYIVGFTSRSMSNMQFENVSADDYTALVLSDTPVGDDFKSTYDKAVLFPVGVSKSMRQGLEEVANAQLLNKQVYAFGSLDTYMGLAGIKNVVAVTIATTTP